MPRAKRIYIPGGVWHLTHRCHNRDFLLRFRRDRVRWRYWLFQARKRYGLSVLNYIVTCNHIHLMVQDRKPGAISKSLQLVAGRVAQEYNQRKSRRGAFWEDRYFATAVSSDHHLIQCLVYIDLNMVRAGVVKHPVQWKHAGCHEIMAFGGLLLVSPWLLYTSYPRLFCAKSVASGRSLGSGDWSRIDGTIESEPTVKQFFLLMTCFLIAGGPAMAQMIETDVEKEVAAVERAFARTMAERDFERFSEFLDEDTVFASGTQVLRGKERVMAAWKPFFDGEEAPFAWEPETVLALPSGDLARSSGPVTSPDGRTVAYYISTWRKDANGEWKIIFDKGQEACPPKSECQDCEKNE